MSEYASYIEGWQRRWREARRADARAARHARRIADRLARRLVDVHGVRRVVLVGSLARGDFGVGSDVDLAAEGIPDESFFRIGADLEAHAGGLHVDLVPIESADDAFLSYLASEGIVLHDATHR
jgi:predicted nucleotidyltransferase